MEYAFRNIHKSYGKVNNVGTTKDILKECNVSTKYDSVLENGTPEEQYEIAKCIIMKSHFRNIDALMLALPLFYAAAKNGHVASQYQMYVYLEEDKHKDAIVYLKTAIDNGDEIAKWAFFRNYILRRKDYLAEPELFNKILKHFEKSTDEYTRVDIGLYYENIIHDYKKAIKYYKNTLLDGEIERLQMVLYEQEHPNKQLRQDIIKKYPKIYKIISNKIVHSKK
jgi:tetratricopeptide (TPR) repeat protein